MSNGKETKKTFIKINTRFGPEDASLFLTSPIGSHLSAFMEFPMFETKEGEFLPVGRADANYASGKVRLSVNQYPIYERRALDLLEGSSRVDDHISDDMGLFRLSEPQGIFEVNGMVVPGKSVTDTPKKDTFWFEYHIGISNGSEDKADNNMSKDLYGRFVMRWYRQSLGFFGYYSPDMYGDNIRTAGSSVINGDPAFMKTGQFRNSATRLGVDFTLSLAAIDIPVWLENQFMSNRESNPTGYEQEFKWNGVFDQLNWQISKKAITYARYDWISGKSFDDTGVGGVTKSKPSENDIVAGVQYNVEQNMKIVAEYRHDVFKDDAMNPQTAKITSDGFTTRFMIGF